MQRTLPELHISWLDFEKEISQTFGLSLHALRAYVTYSGAWRVGNGLTTRTRNKLCSQWLQNEQSVGLS